MCGIRSGLRAKLKGNVSFDKFIEMFDILCFVETWADENDSFVINAEPFTLTREK